MAIKLRSISGRYPFISLEKALAKAQQLFEGDKSGKAMLVPTAFQLWGYSPKSSGGFQTTGALKGYGLIEDEGANDERKVKLSTAARRYFLDERDEIRASMLSDFALNPPLFHTLWHEDGWSEGIPADTVARSHLKIERNLNDQSARSALSIFKENVQFAGLKAGAVRVEPLESEVKQVIEAKPQPEANEVPAMETPAPPITTPLARQTFIGGASGDGISLIGNRVLISVNVDLKGLRKLKRKLKLFETMLAMEDEDDTEDDEEDRDPRD